MLKKQYALLDSTSSIFLNPIVFTNDGDAIRWLTTVVNNKEEQTNISKYPESFSLYRLADYDDSTGLYNPRANEKDITAMSPKQIITAIQVKTDEDKKFTIRELIDMLKTELTNHNIIEIADKKVN